MPKLRNSLLLSTMLTTVSGSAFATTFDETAVTDFPDSPPGPTISFLTYDTVTGSLGTGSDTTDYFTFTDLIAGHHYDLSGMATSSGGFVDSISVGFWDGSAFTPENSLNVVGDTVDLFDLIVPGTELTVGLQLSSGIFSEGYSVTLAEVPVPEPASLALFSVGLASVAFVRRRRKPH